MAADHDGGSELEWGNAVAKYTFIATVIFAALFIGAVVVFIL